MGIDDMLGKGNEFLAQNNDAIDKALHSEQAEAMSDNVLDGAAGLADKLTGGKFGEQIDGVRDAVDKKIGTE